MKSSASRDAAREKIKKQAQKLIRQSEMTDAEIAAGLLCDTRTVVRWRLGTHGPRQGDFRRLQRLVQEKSQAAAAS